MLLRPRRSLLSLLALALAGVLAGAGSPPGRAAAVGHCPRPAGQPIRAAELAPVLRRLVPKHYAGMTNQSGPGAWRRYDVVSEFALGRPTWAGPTYSPIYRTRAIRACGARVAARSWVVIIQFPRAQSALLGTSAAYIVRTKHGLRIWRDQVVHP